MPPALYSKRQAQQEQASECLTVSQRSMFPALSTCRLYAVGQWVTVTLPRAAMLDEILSRKMFVSCSRRPQAGLWIGSTKSPPPTQPPLPTPCHG